MIQIGKYNTLTILRDTKVGLFLGNPTQDPEGIHDILLPNSLKYAKKAIERNKNTNWFTANTIFFNKKGIITMIFDSVMATKHIAIALESLKKNSHEI